MAIMRSLKILTKIVTLKEVVSLTYFP